MLNRRARGRPRKSEITKLKVMSWFNAVAQASGKSAAELEREFAIEGRIKIEDGKEMRPCLWDKYRRGEVEPSLIPPKGRSISVVQAVENKYSGTAMWLKLPIWTLLDFNHPLSIDELRKTYESMPAEIRGLILKESALDGDIFWRKWTDEDVLRECINSATEIEKLTMAIALVREAALFQMEDVFERRNRFLWELLSNTPQGIIPYQCVRETILIFQKIGGY